MTNSIYETVSTFEASESPSLLIGFSNVLPRIALLGESPQAIQGKLFHRDTDGGIYSVKWRGAGIGDEYFWKADKSMNSYLLPQYTGFYNWSESQTAFTLVGKDWATTVETLIKLGKAVLFVPDNSQAVNDGVQTGLQKMKARPKRTGTILGATTETLNDLKNHSTYRM